MPRRFIKHITCFGVLLILTSSCGLLGLGNGNEEATATNSAVARVGDVFLYQSELKGLVPQGAGSEDSLKITSRYINNWIREELLIQEATNSMQIDQSEIERKIAAYRYALIAYEFQRLYVDQQLDKEVTQDEIEAYYQENIDNFILKQNIVQGKYLKLSQEAPKKEEVRRWIRSNKEEDAASLRLYCYQFASDYFLGDSTWINFDEVIKNSPFSTISNKIQFLRRNRYVEEADSSYLYLFRIDAYKISDEVSPLEFVRDDIENIIINKRKVALAKRLEEDIYERAKENEDFEIFGSK